MRSHTGVVTESRRPRLTGDLRPKRLRRESEAPSSAAGSPPAPGPGPGIRPATAHDLTSVIALRALMFAAMGAPTETVSANPWQLAARRWLQVNLTNPLVHVTVADINGSAVACAIGEVIERPPGPANPDGVVGWLGNVATFPEYRKTGLAQRCVDEVMRWFEEETQVTTVDVFATPEGRGLYAARGFVENRFPAMRVRIERDAT